MNLNLMMTIVSTECIKNFFLAFKIQNSHTHPITNSKSKSTRNICMYATFSFDVQLELFRITGWFGGCIF